jgi:hypothetical protein
MGGSIASRRRPLLHDECWAGACLPSHFLVEVEPREFGWRTGEIRGTGLSMDGRIFANYLEIFGT